MKIQLDTVPIAYDGKDDTYRTVHDIASAFPGVTYRIVDLHGPAGGNPVIAYRGPRDELKAMVDRWYGPDAWDAITP